jgi:hypothetical protein
VNIIGSGRWRKGGGKKTQQDAKQDEQKTRTIRMLQADKKAKLADETGEEVKKEHKSIKRKVYCYKFEATRRKKLTSKCSKPAETNHNILKERSLQKSSEETNSKSPLLMVTEFFINKIR